jgi:hypothetical protein
MGKRRKEGTTKKEGGHEGWGIDETGFGRENDKEGKRKKNRGGEKEGGKGV